MAFRFLPDYLDRRDPDTTVAQALATLMEKHRAGKVVLSGWRCTWDRWGGHRETDGRRDEIPGPESRDHHWEREPDSDDFVLVRSDGHFERMDFVRVDPYPQYRNHGWSEIGVDDETSGTRVAMPPAAQPAGATKDTPRRARGAIKKALFAALDDNKTKMKLAHLPDDTACSKFLAAKVGCSSSMARKVLQGKI